MSPAIPLGDRDSEYTDLMGYLVRNRIIFVGSRIDDAVATQIVATLLALEAIDPTADIKLYINSAGGSPYAVVGILDTMRAIQPEISTIAMGTVMSTATVLLAAGKKGKRFAMPSTRVMMHQPAGGAMGSADEVNIQASELNRTMKVIHQFYMDFTGQPLEKIQEETDRDNFLSPQQAMDLGLIDGVI
jgi:ATP-dependent Clp protease protease subunit